MKNSFLNLRAMLLLAVLLCGGVSAFAYTVIWQDSIEYGLRDDLTAFVSDAKNDIRTANIPEKITYGGEDYTVTSIGSYAFYYCHRLASVDIPSSVTSIGYGAFLNCSSLFAYHYKKDGTATLLKAGSLSAEIYGKEAYNIPEKITHVGAEYTVTSIGDYAFEDCSSLASVVIPSSVTSIKSYAFYNCYSLASVAIPSSVTSIGGYAFYGCRRLFAYHYKKDGTATLLKAGSLSAEIYGKEAYNIPEKITHVGAEYTVTSIGDDAFQGCSSLASIAIPSSVTSIGDDAFQGCSSLASVVIPSSVTSIGNRAFYGCRSLCSVTIGSGVQSIAASAFVKYTDNYGSYTYINPKKVIWLGNTPPKGYENVKSEYNYVSNDSFTGLSNTKVYPFLSSMFEKDGIKYVPNPSERTCDAIDCAYDSTAANINIGKTVNYKGVELAVKDIRPYTCYGNKYVKSVKVDYGGAIPENTFYDCEAITTADIMAKVIGVSAFENSATKNPAKFEINADKIGNNAFKGSRAITEAKITAKIIGTSAFENCATENPAKFEITADTIRDNAFTGCGKLENAVLGENLKSVGNSAFKDCTSLKGITIPDSVTGIGGRCFSGCESLAYAKIGAGVSVIPDEAFNNCKSLPEITIPKTVERIGNNVFSGCTSLADVTIADRETELKLGSNGSSPMFSSCPLKSVYIGGNITYGTTANDGYSPFYRNTSLETVRITDSETEISENEFYGCTSLKSVSMGNGIETIGRYAFSGCSALESFSFGTGLKSIGDEAFSDCTGMKKLVSKTATPPVCGPQALDDINKWECTLYVPQESLDAYKSAAQWKEFFFLETGIKNVPNTSSSATESARYSTDGTRIASPQKGINIIRMSDGTVKKVLVK